VGTTNKELTRAVREYASTPGDCIESCLRAVLKVRELLPKDDGTDPELTRLHRNTQETRDLLTAALIEGGPVGQV